MNVTVDNVLMISSVLLLLSVLLGKTSYRFGMPTLVFFLVVGMLAGSQGFGGIYFADAQVAQFVGVVALNFILFSGGFDTKWEEIRPVLRQGIVLSTIGVLLTALILGFFIYAITDFTIYEGLLLGSIVSSTDAAAVFSILRSKGLHLKYNLRPTLELESGSNDPMAYILTIVFTGLVVNQDQTIWSSIPLLLQQLFLGAALGLGFARISKWIINRINLSYEGLYPVLVIALLFLSFSVTDSIGVNGFLATYLMGIYLRNQKLIHKNSLVKFFDEMAWLMQIVLFITLGLLVFPNQLLDILGVGLLIGLFLMFIARPLTVFLTLLPFKLGTRVKTYVSWVGLRGAVPIVFATFPIIAGIEKAPMIFNIVFFISVTSVIIQGTTLPIVARWLGVARPEASTPENRFGLELSEGVRSEMMEVTLPDDNPFVGKRIVDLRFPRNAMITMIIRNEKYIVPRGSTELKAGDSLVVLAEDVNQFPGLLEILQLNKP